MLGWKSASRLRGRHHREQDISAIAWFARAAGHTGQNFIAEVTSLAAGDLVVRGFADVAGRRYGRRG